MFYGQNLLVPLAFSVVVYLSRQSKISHFEFHSFSEEEVAKLQTKTWAKVLLSVDDFMFVHILDSSEELHGITQDFELSKTLSSSDKLVERLVRTELKDDVYILMVFEEMFEAHDIGVAEWAMDLDFAHELEWPLVLPSASFLTSWVTLYW